MTSTLDPTTLPEDGNDRSAGRAGLLARVAAFSARRRRLVITVWLLLTIAAAPLAITLTGALSGAGWEAQGTTSQQVRDEIRRDFATLGAEAAYVVYRQPQSIAQHSAGVQQLVARLRSAPGATSVVDPLAMPASAGLIARDGRTALVPVGLRASVDADLPVSAGELGDYVKGLTFAKGTTANVTGEWPVWADFNKTNEQALHKAELLSGIPSVILLLIAFGSLAAAGLPLLLALAGIAVGFATLHLIGLQLPLSVWAMNFSMMIGLAVGIDYSLFIVSRYREEREAGAGPIDGVANTLGTAGKAVFLSALTVVFSLAAVFVVPVMVFRSMALGMILSVVAVALASLTLLPAVLVALGDRVLVTRGHDDPDVAAESRWTRITGVALRRPALTLATGVVVLAVLVAPALGMRLGMPGAQGRRHRPHQPRRLRNARRGLRSRRRRTRLDHDPRADAAARVEAIASTSPGSWTPAPLPRPLPTAGSSSA